MTASEGPEGGAPEEVGFVTGSYQDRWIECTDTEIKIRGYYVPWGTKHIPYGAIKAVRRVDLGVLRGRGRIWGTANVRYWASLDPGRPKKQTALILDLGRTVSPFITPDDPAAVLACIREHTGLEPNPSDVRSGPIV